MGRACRVLACAALLLFFAQTASSQISLTSAVDLALRTNPKVLMAQADADRALAGLQESRDVYIPTISGGSGLGYSYGFPLGQPTLFNFQAQSLVFSAPQREYVRSARTNLAAANLTLQDVRQAVAEDTVLTYIALDHDLERVAALQQQRGFALRLTDITQERLGLGQDTEINLTTAKISAAQIRLALIHSQNDVEVGQAHLARLTGLPFEGLTTIHSSVPTIDTLPLIAGREMVPDPPAVQAAFVSAEAKLHVAKGDSRWVFYPQLGVATQYSRFARFNGYGNFYLNYNPNNFAFGVQLNLPLVDAARRARARGSRADAVHAQREAELARNNFRDGRLRTERNATELSARLEIASLDQQLAEQQLDVILVQLTASTGGPPLTPKDEQRARLAERDKYIGLLDARFQMQTAQVSLLRQAGALESWLKAAAQMQPSAAIATRP